MDRNKLMPTKKYDRVMPRVYSDPRLSLNSQSFVTRHEKSPSKVGGKPSTSNVSSSIFSELPVVLNDYNPVEHVKKVMTPRVVKPRKTVKSLDPCLSPVKPRVFARPRVSHRPPNSAPSLPRRDTEGWSDALRQCHSSHSQTQLHELKSEIQSFRETERFQALKAKLYESCGVVLNDDGQLCEDKSVQVDPEEKALTSCQLIREPTSLGNIAYLASCPYKGNVLS
ncbi:hypothetical protein JYU34_013334 [Plutella xylostella]|uniref:Uncharacterized protein n=1 Tax=Plutella xylostella TaxID=51655 RepID=A0ABQ7Q9K9_PLUXY|nr:hypothetical protein JYU34_013334 [Plutella xylostella]